jgi:hypothetical protein
LKLDFAASIEFTDGMPIVETLEVVKIGVADTLKFFERDFPVS